MKQKLLNKLWLRVGMIVAIMTTALSGTAWAETATWAGTTALPGTATAIGDSPIKIMTSSTNTYSNPIRIYASTTITITATTGYVIQSVTYEASSTGTYVTNAQQATVSPSVTPTVSDNNVIWTLSNASEFTFTPSAQTRSNGITVTYTTSGGGGDTPTTYTVTLGDNNSTLTEASSGAGVTLPSRSDVGIYTFAGWSTTNVTTETTTAPTIIIPAGTYSPTENVTLYPVYTKTEGGSAPSAFAVGDTGDFVIIADKKDGSGKYYALPSKPTVNSGKITAGYVTVSELGGVKYVTPEDANGFTWTIAAATNGYTLSDGSNYIYHSNGGNSGTNLAYGISTNYTWSFTEDDDYVKMAGMNGSTVNSRGLLFSSTTIGGYALSNWGTSGYFKTMILPVSAGVTVYYYSTPVVKQENGILYVSEEYHNMDLSADGNCELNLGGVVASHGTLYSQIVTESTTINPSNYTWDLQVLDVSGLAEGQGGKVVIRFWVEEDAEYYGIEKIVTAYFRPKPVIAYDGETETAYGTPYTIDTELIEGGDITLSSSNESVATVDGLTITPVAVGTTTITITTAAVDDTWQAGTATFTLNVTAPEGKEKAATGDFVKVTSNDDLTDGKYLIVYEEGSVAFNGGLETLDGASNTIDVALNNNKIAATSATEAATFTIDVTSGTIQSASGLYIGQTSDANGMVTSKETANTNTISFDSDYNANIVASGGAYLRYNATSGQDRFRYYKSTSYTGQKAIQLYKQSIIDMTFDVKLNASGYATFCSEYPLDFSDYETAGYSAWAITAVSGDKITFSQITGSIKGGQGILLKGTAGETVTLTSVNSTNTISGNLLEGTLAPMNVAAEQYYGLSGSQFVKVNAGTVPAGKALLPASALSSNVKAFTFVFEDDATGIEETLSNSPLKGENIYNLAGQMVNGKSVNGKLPKGIYIVNGKKVMVK